jgi:2-phosphosulfolactate phosphatase
MTFDQAAFEIRCEWGENGVAQLAPISDVVIIVDVLSFSTCVDIAVGRGAAVYPFRLKDVSRAREYADSIQAELAGRRGSESRYSLSPLSMLDVSAGTKVVLPSPNGSNLTLSTGKTVTLAGCLRNCRVVAEVAMRYGKRIAVIPAGERWKLDNSLRPAIEDLIGAGAIIHHLEGEMSPEARVAVGAFLNARHELQSTLKQCASGKELAEMGFEKDIELAAELDVSNNVPVFLDSAYRGDSPA